MSTDLDAAGRNCTQSTQSIRYHTGWGELCPYPARGSGRDSPQFDKTGGERRIGVSYDMAEPRVCVRLFAGQS